jgi:osmotically-inducible protein OsmY
LQVYADIVSERKGTYYHEVEDMALSDDEIKKRIVDDLQRIISVDVSMIQVIVDNGRVILSGIIPPGSARDRITEAVYRIMDVLWVDNLLAVSQYQASS